MIDIIHQYWQAYLFWDGSAPSGLIITLWLLVASLAIGFVLALPLSIARASGNRFVSRSVWLFTYVFRGTPLYVQLLLIYTGFYTLDFVRSHASLESFFRSGMNCALFAFALNTCAYTTEIFAGAIRTVERGEIEAARAYGMSVFTRYRRIILPAALRRALPAYSNEVILMLHATTLAFTATVPDLLKVARDINAQTYQPLPAFGLAALIYLSVSFLLIWLFRKAEHRWLAFLRPRQNES